MSLSVLSFYVFLLISSAIRPASTQNISLDTGANITYPLPVHTVYQFPVATWIENLAVRENGQIIATEDTRPRIYQIDPFEPDQAAILLHEFDDTSSILGIVETSPDVFYVCSANYSSKLLQGYGEAYVYKVDMRSFLTSNPTSLNVSKLTSLTEAAGPNGMTFFANSLLISDFIRGVIWSVDIDSGNVQVAANNSYTQSTAFGANGIKVHGGELYFTNTQQETIVKVALDPDTGAITGNYTIMAQGGITPDDFAVDTNGNLYVTSFTVGQNGLAFVPYEGGNATYIAGMAGPTGAAFGRTVKDRDVLYVSTSGGDYNYLTGEPVTVAGSILSIQVGRSGAT